MSTDCDGEETDSLPDLEIDDYEFNIPPTATPSLESILWDIESDGGSADSTSINSLHSAEHKIHSIMSHCILQSISSQMSKCRTKAGKPTVLTNTPKYIAIGTSQGFIFNFDPEQNMCWGCHDPQTFDQGAVSALAFNLDSTRLLAGFERGFIIMIDANNGDVLRRLPDAHAPQSAVLHVRFTFLNNLSLCGDSTGCVFSMTFRRRLGVRSWQSKCLFSGATGEVCVFEPLTKGYDLEFLTRTVLVAMASMSKVIVISIRPQVKCLFSQPLPRLSNSLPQLSWQLVPIGNALQPVLAWGRGAELNFTRLIVQDSKNVKFVSLRNVQLGYDSISVNWLGTQHLALIDSTENLHLMDVRTQKELEILEMTSAELVYNSAHFKGLAVGGGVSEALSLAGERACYNTISSRGDQLLVLGTSAINVIKMRSWPERLTHLSDRGRWSDALHLAADDSGADRDRFATAFLLKYLDRSNHNAFDKEGLAAAIKCCVKLSKIDILCNELWEAVSTNLYHQDWYYFLLTDHVINGKLTTLTPVVMQKLVEYLEKKDIQTLENILLLVDVNCLDLHQVLTICKTHKLYNAWIHITTKTIGDYTSPLTEFLSELTTSNARLGNTMLVYVSSCLAGLGYPRGNIPEDKVTEVKFEVLRCLETLHSVNGKENEKTYPYLRALLKFNIRECLNVVELAFTEEEFSGEMGLLQRRRLTQILVEVVQQPDFSESEELNLACFITRLVTSNRINLEEKYLEKIFDILTTKSAANVKLRDNAEREQSWLDLLSTHRMKVSEELLQRALEAKCYRVAEFIYLQQNEYSNILTCYLNDVYRRNEVFGYISKYINDDDRCIKEQFLVHFIQLVAIDTKKTVCTVMEYFPDIIEQFCEILQDEDQLRYLFLRELTGFDVRLPPRIAELYLDLLCSNEPDKVKNFLDQNYCRTEEALVITRKYGLHAASAVLLEHGGEWLEALELLLESNLIEDAISLCVRGSEHLDSAGAQRLWTILLRHQRTTDKSTSLLQLLRSTVKHVPVPQLLESLSEAKFGDVRVLLQGIFADALSDLQLNKITLELLSKDFQRALAQSLLRDGRGVHFANNCSACHGVFGILGTRSSAAVSAWGCGHIFHQDCWTESENQSACQICRHKAVMVQKSLPKSRCEMKLNAATTRPDLEGHL